MIITIYGHPPAEGREEEGMYAFSVTMLLLLLLLLMVVVVMVGWGGG